MKYGQITLGQIEALLNKVGGPDSVKRILSGLTSVLVVWKTWKTIELGWGPKTIPAFYEAIEQAGMKMEKQRPGYPSFSITTEKTAVDLVNVSVEELGFKDGADQKEVYARACELGLDLCPAEVAPRLRLEYVDQPAGDILVVAMEPVFYPRSMPRNSDYYLHYILLGEQQADGSKKWLVLESVCMNAKTRIIFVRRK